MNNQMKSLIGAFSTACLLTKILGKCIQNQSSSLSLSVIVILYVTINEILEIQKIKGKIKISKLQ